jgi:hypothetical protein
LSSIEGIKTRRRNFLCIGKIEGNMRVNIRPARLADTAILWHIKDQLRLKLEPQAETRQDGFLLGTSLDEYQRFIERDIVFVAETDIPPAVIGFAIALPYETLAQSMLLQRAENIKWKPIFDLNSVAKRFAFFEQLGMLPDTTYRVYAKYLAFSTVWHIFQTHEALFTTVLQYPVMNTAALSFIRVVGFENVGHVDETYPEFGRVKSDVYYLERDVFMHKTKEPRLKAFMEQARRGGYL